MQTAGALLPTGIHAAEDFDTCTGTLKFKGSGPTTTFNLDLAI